MDVKAIDKFAFDVSQFVSEIEIPKKTEVSEDNFVNSVAARLKSLLGMEKGGKGRPFSQGLRLA